MILAEIMKLRLLILCEVIFMSGRNNIEERQFKSYKRNHSEGYFRDNEESKVKRDKLYVKKVEKQMQKTTNIMEDISDENIEEYENMLFKNKKARGSVKTHNKRFKALSRIDAF